MKYACSDCGEVFWTKEAAEICCGESAELVSECCEAPVVSRSKRSYPLAPQNTLFFEEFDIEVCEKCHHEVECA